MTQSNETKNLLAALVEVQSELPTMPKDSQAYGYKYADLDLIAQTIKPILKKHKIGYMQSVGSDENGAHILTTRIFDAHGEYIEDTALLPVISGVKNNAAQVLGMSITYMRRYALCAMLGITSDEDTDANPQGNPPRNNAQQGNQPKSNGGARNAPPKPQPENGARKMTDAQIEEMKKMYAGDIFSEEEKDFYRKESGVFLAEGGDPAAFVKRVSDVYERRLNERSKEWREQKRGEAVGAEAEPPQETKEDIF